MKKFGVAALTFAALVLIVAGTGAQPPEGKGGKGGKGGGAGGPPRFELGQVLPTAAHKALELTDDQEKEVAKLEAEVKDRLSKILTADQVKKLKEMPAGGRGGRGGRGPGGPGGPGGAGGGAGGAGGTDK
jgi:hypothetical protein